FVFFGIVAPPIAVFKIDAQILHWFFGKLPLYASSQLASIFRISRVIHGQVSDLAHSTLLSHGNRCLLVSSLCSVEAELIGRHIDGVHSLTAPIVPRIGACQQSICGSQSLI